MTCDCPLSPDCFFCPLVEMNMQEDSVIVYLPTGKKVADLALADTVRGDFSVQAKLNILKIVLFARNNMMKSKKDSTCFVRAGTEKCYCIVERISKEVFDFSFHAKEKEAEDPK